MDRLERKDVEAALEGKRGPALWRSLEELAGSESFRDFLEREFPRQAALWDRAVDRRSILRLMAASLVLSGLAGCGRQPEEAIIPYVDQPEGVVPGVPRYYATALSRDGYATGVIAETHLGRPTKLSGNPDHPASLGATDAMIEAAPPNLR